MDGERRAILLVADISGYTDFVRRDAVTASHARQIVGRILRAMVEAVLPPIEVAEIEGDAVFLYAMVPERDRRRVTAAVERQIPGLFRAFQREVSLLSREPRCSCEACAAVAELELKQVLHAGDVAVDRIGRFEKLFGLDVIVVHRMLKNSVPARRYVMLTPAAAELLCELYGLEGERRTEAFDGVGDIEVRVFRDDRLDALLARVETEAGPVRTPSVWAWMWWRLRMRARTLVDVLEAYRREGATR